MRAFTDERTRRNARRNLARRASARLHARPGGRSLASAGSLDSGIPLVKVDRGGQITYHGPGQVVAYLLLDLRRRKLMVRELVTRIEQAVIDTLAAYNLAGERKAGAPGIYVAPGAGKPGSHAGAKIAALGLKIRNGCSYHGVSLNVNMDLRPFLVINPCGYAGLETVDMATLGVAAGWDDVARTLQHASPQTSTAVPRPSPNRRLVRSPPDWTERMTDVTANLAAASSATPDAAAASASYDATAKQKAQAKTSRIPIKIIPIEKLKKPDWIRVKAATGNSRFYEIKQILREHNLHTVCEEASCPNIGECFGKGTATFMIMGDKCTRRCPFCDVGHGRPDPLDPEEPGNLARTIARAQAEVRGDHERRP